MATGTAEKKAAGKSGATGKSSVQPEPETIEADAPAEDAGEAPTAEQEAAQNTKAEKERSDHEEALEILEPKAEAKRWVIGKPPEAGGTEDEYSIYVQKPLGYMSRMRFFSLVSRTIAQAIKAGGAIDLGEGDIFAQGGGNMRQRVQQLRQADFADASSFMTLAMQLIGYSPDFLLECYCLWLEVPASERTWAKMVMDQVHDPDRNKWGLTDEEGMEIIEVFIDQNYEDIRGFFVDKLPRLGRRVQQRELERAARESESAQSKQ